MAYWGGVNSVSADPVIVKTPVLLTGGVDGCNPAVDYYFIEMQGWQQFIAYEDAEGVAFDEDSYMQFDLKETVSNGEVRVDFFFDDETHIEAWWCLGIGESKDDTSTPYAHDFDESKYWLKKGLGENFDSKKTCKIKKVLIKNFNKKIGETPILVTYKVIGGTICGEDMTIKNDNTVKFGYYGGVFSPTAAQKNIFKIKPFAVGDYQKLVIEFGAPTPSGWAIVTADGWPPDLETGITKKEISLSGTDLSEFSIFNWNAAPSSINIKEVYLYKEVNEIDAAPVYEAPAGTTDLKNFTGTNTGWASTVTYPKTFEHQGEAFGDGNGDAEATHVTITGYDYINFVVTDATADGVSLRVWIWNGSSVTTLYPHPIADYATADYSSAYRIETPGVYTVKVSGYDYLKGVKASNYWSGAWTPVTVSLAYANKGAAPASATSYELSGTSTLTAAVTTALADANAIYYDATGIVDTGVDLTSVANPNALFKANDGALANTQNVIVGTTCANLVLADNHPFGAPFNFTATLSSYGRVFTSDQITTVCLPFALTAAEAATLGTFYELSSFDGATLHFSAVAAPEANKAYLVKTAATALALEEANKSIAATPADLGTTITSVDFIGTLASTTIPASDGTYSYYAYNNGALVKIVTNAATLPAFRGYFKISTSAINLSARELTLSFDDDVTGISQIETTRIVDNADAFDLQGRRVAQPTKGLYVVNGKKVIIK